MTDRRSAKGNSSRLRYPQDRFDRVPVGGAKGARVGAHRVDPQAKQFGKWALAVIGLTIVCTVIGILVLNFGGSQAPAATEVADTTSSSAAAAKQIDPEATVAIVNGTADEALGKGVEKAIEAENLGRIAFVGQAETADVKLSAVFYSDPAKESAAAALASKLGGLSHYQNDSYAQYESDLVVVLGSNYSGPGA